VDLRISTKIVGTSLLISSIFIVVGLVGVTKVRSLATQQDLQYQRNVTALSFMTSIRSAVGAQQEAVVSFILSNPGFYRTQYGNTVTETDTSIDRDITRLQAIDLDRNEILGLESLQRTLAMWRAARDGALAASRSGDDELAKNIILVRSEAVASDLKERANGFLTQLVNEVALGAQQAHAESQDTVRLIVALLATAAVVAILLSILAARTISRPLRQTVTLLARVAGGDFSPRLDAERRDEIGQMGRSLNETLSVLRSAFEQLQHSAQHDTLTGLANRALLYERLDGYGRLAATGGTGVPVQAAMVLVDLDGFKQVNDTYGHAAGDKLLQAVATRLTASVRVGDTVARLGGDEFAVLLTDINDRSDAYRTAERLLDTIQTHVVFDSVELRPQASVGVTMWDGRTPPDRLLHEADVAMYAAKTSGKGRVVMLDEEHPAVAGTSPARLGGFDRRVADRRNAPDDPPPPAGAADRAVHRLSVS
jgi:diguanylate cyclase (GGDEF)-like protein